MKQISLFGDEFFDEPKAPQKKEDIPVKKTMEQPELPSDLDAKFESDEKSLEENYVMEIFILPEEELTDGIPAESSEVKEEPVVKYELPKPPQQITEPTPKRGRGRMKLSEMEERADLLNLPDDETLFQKRYYSIGAVADMFNVNISLLRYWENEFDILKPKKNGKGDRHFRPEDIKNIQLIYHLLREKKYTLQGAKDFLKKNRDADKHFEVIESLQNLKSFLLELKSTI